MANGAPLTLGLDRDHGLEETVNDNSGQAKLRPLALVTDVIQSLRSNIQVADVEMRHAIDALAVLMSSVTNKEEVSTLRDICERMIAARKCQNPLLRRILRFPEKDAFTLALELLHERCTWKNN